jgi:hypothetical protein
MAEPRTIASSSRRTRTGDSAIGPFIIGSEIGKGSFATVYVGKHQVRQSYTSYPLLMTRPALAFSPRDAIPVAVVLP